MIQGLRAAQQNLPFMPVQLPEGSTMMERCPAVHFHRDERTGRLDRAGRGADDRHRAAARAARRYGRKCRDLWRAGARPADRRRCAAGAGDRGGDRAGGHAAAERPPDDHHPQSRHRHRRSAGRRVSDVLPAPLRDGLSAHPRDPRRQARLARRGAAKAGRCAARDPAEGREGAGREGRPGAFPQRGAGAGERRPSTS